MSEFVARGACLCGAVSFEIDLPAKWCAYCHCSQCRRAHGAPYVAWVGVARDHLRLTSGQDSLGCFHSSDAATRSFCSGCGSSLFFESTRWADEVHIARALLGDDVDLVPMAHCFFSDRARWVSVSDALPRLGGDNGTTPLE